MMARYIPPPDRALWDRYLVVLERSGVEPDRRRWYVLRVERFLHAHRAMSLGGLTSAHVQQWFERIVLVDRAYAWRVQQAAEALRLFLCDLLALPWAATSPCLTWSATKYSPQ